MTTKFSIRWLIGLMGAAVLGLLGFQFFWINNALQLHNEQFDLKVADALQEVVRKLEKQEIRYLIQQREQIEQQRHNLATISKNRLVQISKRPNRQAAAPALGSDEATGWIVEANPTDALTPKTRPFTDGQQRLINEFLRQRAAEDPVSEQFLRVHQEQEQFLNEWFGQFFQTRNRLLKANQLSEGEFPLDSLEKAFALPNQTQSQQVWRKQVQKIKTKAAQLNKNERQETNRNHQAQLLKDVFRDLLFGQRPIEQRVNRQTMDSLLKKALQERRITIPYDFAVKINNAPNLVFSTVAFRADAAISDLFKTTLFPNELNAAPSELLVYFPDRRGFVLQNIGLTLASSAALLLVILGCFYVAVSTILKQKKLAEIKNDFVNNMTHEFKTPISTIALAVGMAEEQTQTQPEPARLKRYLKIIGDENKRLGEHVEKVLQMALLERGAIRLNLTTVNIHDTIEKVLNSIGVQLEQRQGEVELEFEATQEYIEADELHLTNILYNLIDNANKYSSNRPHLHIGTRNDDAGLYVRVGDQGQGMGKEQLSRIFEPFYRVPTGNRHDVKGFGLGLSYVKKMTEVHGGRISAESQLGRGSTFEIFLPFQNHENLHKV